MRREDIIKEILKEEDSVSYIVFEGKCYGIGTKLVVYNDHPNLPNNPCEVEFRGYEHGFPLFIRHDGTQFVPFHHKVVSILEPVEYTCPYEQDYFIYDDKIYKYGTIVKIYVLRDGKTAISEPVIFEGCTKKKDKKYETYIYRSIIDLTRYEKDMNPNVAEILEPAGCTEIPDAKRRRRCPMKWQIENAWIWYIIVMFCGAFFYDRWKIWIFATVYFILWANGIF